jgi:hypothetical protein
MLLAALWVCAGIAAAGEISVRAMDDFGGASTEPTGGAGGDFVVTGFKQVVLDLGTAIANKPLMPGETLGTNGFHVGVGSTFAFVRTSSGDGTNPGGWQLVDPTEQPSPLLFIPQVQLRKGLPLSLELGANFGWVGMSNTAVVGAFGRWGLLEGYKPLPDLSIQVGYAGYVGNDELEVGVLDMGATVGYTLPFGPIAGVHTASFSPFVGIGLLRVRGAPRVDLSATGLDGRLAEVTGFDDDPLHYDETLAPLQVAGGFRILNGSFDATVSGAYCPGLLPSVNLAFGFTW